MLCIIRSSRVPCADWFVILLVALFLDRHQAAPILLLAGARLGEWPRHLASGSQISCWTCCGRKKNIRREKSLGNYGFHGCLTGWASWLSHFMLCERCMEDKGGFVI